MFSPTITSARGRRNQSCGSSSDGMHHCQHQKLRAQNRAAQRACRDRKVRYIQGLEDKIQETEERLGALRGENSELIRALCKIREENIDFRDALNIAKGVRHTLTSAGYGSMDSDGSSFARDDTPSSSATSSDSLSNDDRSDSLPHGPSSDLIDEHGSLQDLLSSIWKLIRSHPGVSHGAVSAQVVLDRLISQIESR